METILAFVVVTLVALSDSGSNPEVVRAIINHCDMLAASPYDPTRPPTVPGVLMESINGPSAAKECEKALKADPTNARINFELGRSLEHSGETTRAAHLYREGAVAGNSLAMDAFAKMLGAGTGFSKDETAAASWYRKSAEAGYAGGMVDFGVVLGNGAGVTKNDHEAAMWFRKAAEAGLPHGMYDLGWALENGVGVAKNNAEAAGWYLKASEAGNADAMNAYAVMLESGDAGKRDHQAAIALLQKAVSAGSKDAAQNLKTFSTAGQTNGDTAQDLTSGQKLMLGLGVLALKGLLSKDSSNSATDPSTETYTPPTTYNNDTSLQDMQEMFQQDDEDEEAERQKQRQDDDDARQAEIQRQQEREEYQRQQDETYGNQGDGE